MKFSNTLKSALPAVALGFLALGLAPTSAFAVTTATTNMAVSATVAAACSVTATPMAFGSYSALVASTSTSTLSVTCTTSTPYILSLNGGSTSGGLVTARLMTTGGAVMLGYGLYTNAGFTTNFGTQASTNGTGSAQTTTVYGQIPAAQYVTPGAYTDTIVATVSY